MVNETIWYIWKSEVLCYKSSQIGRARQASLILCYFPDIYTEVSLQGSGSSQKKFKAGGDQSIVMV